MKKLVSLSLVLGTIVLIAGLDAASAAGPASDVASLLSGSYRLQGDNTDVRLKFAGVGGTGSTLDLLATASGTYKGKDVHQQAVIRLASEGPDVEVTAIPRFTPVTEASPDVTRFSDTESQAACTFYLKPHGNGWVGATQGTVTCVAGAAGKWEVDITPGTIRFTNPETKQVLVFHKT